MITDSGRKIREIKCHFHHLISRGYINHQHNITTDVDLDHVGQVVFASFLHWKVYLAPFVHSVLFGRRSLCLAHSWGVMLPLFRVEYLYKLFGIFLHRRFFSSSFINLSTHLFKSIKLMNICCILWVIIQIYFICCPNFSYFVHWVFFWLAPVLLWHAPIVLFWTLPYFLRHYRMFQDHLAYFLLQS